MTPKELIAAWIVGSVLLLVSCWLCALNARIFWKGFVRKENAASWIPLVGCMLGAFGLGVIPVGLAHRLCFLPLVLDYGCLPGFFHTVYAHAARFIRERRH